MHSRERAVLARCTHYTEKQKAAIRENMRKGLLCACNATRIPYFPKNGTGAQGEGHGMKRINGITHGYDDCA